VASRERGAQREEIAGLDAHLLELRGGERRILALEGHLGGAARLLEGGLGDGLGRRLGVQFLAGLAGDHPHLAAVVLEVGVDGFLQDLRGDLGEEGQQLGGVHEGHERGAAVPHLRFEAHVGSDLLGSDGPLLVAACHDEVPADHGLGLLLGLGVVFRGDGWGSVHNGHGESGGLQGQQ
jgi:hypothetical protein